MIRIIGIVLAAWVLVSALLHTQHVDAVMMTPNCELHADYMSCGGPENGAAWLACDYTIEWDGILAEPAACVELRPQSYERRDYDRTMCFAGRVMIDGRLCAAAWLFPEVDQ